MSVLSGEKIKQRANEIFQPNYYDETCIDVAAYNLRVNDKNIIINGIKYDDNNPYPYRENKGFIKLPPRKISLLSTIEKLTLPSNLCARVGITFSWSRRGLIPLFGPQVDPGYNDYFYAVVYNASNKEIMLGKGEKLFKIEFHTVEGLVKINHSFFNEGLPPIDPDITKEDSVGDLSTKIDNFITKVDDLAKEVGKSTTRIEEVASGYRSVVWFGIFLVAASIFGVVLSFLLSNANYTNYSNLVSLLGSRWLLVIIISIIALFIASWILTVIAVIRGISK